MKKGYFTVVFTKEVPVKVDIKESDSNEDIEKRCYEEAGRIYDNFEMKMELVVKLSDWIKNKVG